MYLLLPQSLHFCLFQLVLVGGGAQDALRVIAIAVAAPIVIAVVSVIALVAVTGEEREGGQCV